MRYFSMFSGIGGFEYGIDRAIRQLQQEMARKDDSQDNKDKRILLDSGSTCIGYSEIDKYADAIYQYNFGGKNYGDATKIDTKQLPDFDLLVGGFPCQAFSIAGKRQGFNDTRGTLFFEIARILRDKKPRHFILENVKGLLSHEGGETFQTIIGVLTDLGYFVEWQVLNSKNFGVPQNRERVFIVGHLGGFGGRQIFPIRKRNKGTNETDGGGTQTDIARTVDTRTGSYPKWGQYIKQLNNPTHSNNRIYGEKGISHSLNTAQGGNRQPKIPVLTPDRIKKRQNGRRFKTDGEPSFTLNTQDKHGVYDGMKIRRLTPIECERLQGFPDNWTKYGIFDGEVKEISDTQRYKVCGNAVTTNVVSEVFKRLEER